MGGTRSQFSQAGLLILVGTMMLLRASPTPQEQAYPVVSIETNAEAKKLTLTISDQNRDLSGLRLIYASYTETGKDQVLLKQRKTSISTYKHKFSFEMDAPVVPCNFEFEIELGNLDLSTHFQYTAGAMDQSKEAKWIPLE